MNSEYIYVYFQLLKDTFSNIYKTAVVGKRARGRRVDNYTASRSLTKK
jgi:hypothetical protein